MDHEFEAGAALAIENLNRVDSFHSRDPIECLEAAKALVDGLRTILVAHPEVLIALLSGDSGRLMLGNSADVLSTCLDRVMNTLIHGRRIALQSLSDVNG